MAEDVAIGTMSNDEFADVRAAQIDSFGDDEIGVLLDALRASWSFLEDLNFVARAGGEIVGHLQVSSALLDTEGGIVDVLLLSPVGVVPSHQGAGVGGRLIRHALDALTARPEPAVFLEGDPGYYARFGFREAGQLGFRKPSDRIPDPAFQVVTLPSYRPSLRGTVVYPDAFWLTDSVGLRDWPATIRIRST